MREPLVRRPSTTYAINLRKEKQTSRTTTETPAKQPYENNTCRREYRERETKTERDRRTFRGRRGDFASRTLSSRMTAINVGNALNLNCHYDVHVRNGSVYTVQLTDPTPKRITRRQDRAASACSALRFLSSTRAHGPQVDSKMPTMGAERPRKKFG